MKNELERKIIEIIKSDDEHFFSPEFDGLISREEHSYKEVLTACFSLEKQGILKRRDCVELAFEMATL